MRLRTSSAEASRVSSGTFAAASRISAVAPPAMVPASRSTTTRWGARGATRARAWRSIPMMNGVGVWLISVAGSRCRHAGRKGMKIPANDNGDRRWERAAAAGSSLATSSEINSICASRSAAAKATTNDSTLPWSISSSGVSGAGSHNGWRIRKPTSCSPSRSPRASAATFGARFAQPRPSFCSSRNDCFANSVKGLSSGQSHNTATLTAAAAASAADSPCAPGSAPVTAQPQRIEPSSAVNEKVKPYASDAPARRRSMIPRGKQKKRACAGAACAGHRAAAPPGVRASTHPSKKARSTAATRRPRRVGTAGRAARRRGGCRTRPTSRRRRPAVRRRAPPPPPPRRAAARTTTTRRAARSVRGGATRAPSAQPRRAQPADRARAERERRPRRRRVRRRRVAAAGVGDVQPLEPQRLDASNATARAVMLDDRTARALTVAAGRRRVRVRQRFDGSPSIQEIARLSRSSSASSVLLPTTRWCCFIVGGIAEAPRVDAAEPRPLLHSVVDSQRQVSTASSSSPRCSRTTAGALPTSVREGSLKPPRCTRLPQRDGAAATSLRAVPGPLRRPAGRVRSVHQHADRPRARAVPRPRECAHAARRHPSHVPEQLEDHAEVQSGHALPCRHPSGRALPRGVHLHRRRQHCPRRLPLGAEPTGHAGLLWRQLVRHSDAAVKV